MKSSFEKKSLAFAIIVLFFGISIIPSIVSIKLNTVEAENGKNEHETKKWTFMFYDDTDFFGGYHPLDNFTIGKDFFPFGDFDGDGDIDLLFTYDEDELYEGWLIHVNGTVNLLENDGENNFGNLRMVAFLGPGEPFDKDNRINTQLTSADFDRDGDIDFLVGSTAGEVEFFSNDGTGNFTSNGVIYDYGQATYGLASADFNDDGWIDFIVVPGGLEENGTLYDHIYLKLNEGLPSHFAHDPGEIIVDLPLSMMSTFGGRLVGCLISLDYNGDGWMDFIYVRDNMVFLLIKKDGVFKPFYVCRFPDNSEGYMDSLVYGALTMGDFNNDGLDDIVAGGVQGVVRLFGLAQ